VLDSRAAARTDARRRLVLDALTAVFLAEGFAALTMATIADRLHCSKTTLYLVASSKEQIVVTTVRDFFRRAADRIETGVAAQSDPVQRVRVYLEGVATELDSASGQFFADLLAFPPANEVYQDNTLFAARRVRELVDEGVLAGVLRPAHTAFVGAAVTQVMTAIQRGEIAAATGLGDAQAYRELADLILSGLGTPPGAPAIPDIPDDQE
jgi:AcrR family transcriptional regulator